MNFSIKRLLTCTCIYMYILQYVIMTSLLLEGIGSIISLLWFRISTKLVNSRNTAQRHRPHNTVSAAENCGTYTSTKALLEQRRGGYSISRAQQQLTGAQGQEDTCPPSLSYSSPTAKTVRLATPANGATKLQMQLQPCSSAATTSTHFIFISRASWRQHDTTMI